MRPTLPSSTADWASRGHVALNGGLELYSCPYVIRNSLSRIAHQHLPIPRLRRDRVIAEATYEIDLHDATYRDRADSSRTRLLQHDSKSGKKRTIYYRKITNIRRRKGDLVSIGRLPARSSIGELLSPLSPAQ